jgi:hypothetical protein
MVDPAPIATGDFAPGTRIPPPGTLIDFPPVEKINARRGSWFYAYENQGLARWANPTSNPGRKSHRWILFKDGISLERDDNHVSILPEPSSMAYQVYYFTTWLFLDLQSDMEVKSDHLRRIFKSGRPSDMNSYLMLPRCLREHRDAYRIRPILEAVDGHPCHVLEWPDHDVIWIDPSIGCMARRRLLYRPVGHLGVDLTHSGFEEKAAGIWIPRSSKSISYNAEDSGDYRTKVHSIGQNILIDAKVNDVPDSVFTVPIPDGARIHDFIRGITYDKLLPADKPLDRGLKRGALDLAIARERTPRRLGWPDWLLLMGIGAQLAFAGVLLARRQTKPASA